MVGHTLGHYRIVKKIASGGMGDVFLAEDTTLERRVALKTLPPESADDPGRRARLNREAKAIAALNHPNIVTVYSVERAAEIDFMTMELVEGHMLGELLPHRGFPLDRFFELALPLVDAVAAAHRHGIMHRDLKPANVMVSDAGVVKVLDFGLARMARPPADAGAATLTASPTLIGQVVGTPAYMSPEQAEGRDVDTRSDIFSLGVLFYEMLTGRRPFAGQTPTATIAAIVKDAPRSLTEVISAIPRNLSRAVHRCLAKNPIDRYQTATDLRHALEDAKQDWSSGDSRSVAAAGARRGVTSRIGVAGAVLAALALLIVGSSLERLRARWNGNAAPLTPRAATTVRVTSSLIAESYPSWSPDGQKLAFQSNDVSYGTVGNVDIWVAQAGSGDPVNLTKGSLANDRRPSWSPDGREIAFYSDRDGQWGVYVMSAIGGTPRKVQDVTVGASTSAPQWSADGSTLFIAAREKDRNAVIQLSLGSLQATRLLLPEHDSPQTWDLSIRPDGSRFAYVEAGGGNPEVGRLWTIAVSGDNSIPLTDGRHFVGNPTWSPDGKQLFYVTNRGGTMDLWQQSVDADGQPAGEPRPMTNGQAITSAALSPDGTKLAFARASRVSNIWRAPIVDDRPVRWSDASRVTNETSYIEFVDVSPDGQTLALSSNRRGNQDLWLMSAAGGEMTQLTNDPTPDWNPRWSPDGKDIAFYAYRSGNRDIWVMPSRGGPARQVTARLGIEWYPSWSPDGKTIAFQSQRTGQNSTWIVSAQGGEPRSISRELADDWSPDGKWLVGRGPGGLYRIPLDGTAAEHFPVPHTVNFTRIARDGKTIYYSVVEGARDHHDLWRFSLATRTTSRLTDLIGPAGRIGYMFSTDDRYLYFLWVDDAADIFVMDAPTGSGR